METNKQKTENIMRSIYIEKVVLRIGTGNDPQKIEKAVLLLKRLTNKKPTKTIAKKRIAGWNIRPGVPIGAMVTIRGKDSEEILKRLLEAKDNKIKGDSFDQFGNFSFGIEEYIEIPGIKYDPKIGILGMDVCVTLARPGYRVKHKKNKKKIGKKHIITKQEAMDFMIKKFNIEII